VKVPAHLILFVFLFCSVAKLQATSFSSAPTGKASLREVSQKFEAVKRGSNRSRNLHHSRISLISEACLSQTSIYRISLYHASCRALADAGIFAFLQAGFWYKLPAYSTIRDADSASYSTTVVLPHHHFW
jgi:hypothetical protein